MKRTNRALPKAVLLALSGLLALAAAPKLEPAKPEQVADAKAQVAKMNLACEVGDVHYIGQGNVNGPDKKPVKVELYELSCSNRYGYILQGPKGGSELTAAQSCPGLKQTAESNKKEKLTLCQLPQNEDVKSQLQSMITKSGSDCKLQNYRWVGLTPDHADAFEIACSTGPGYRMLVPATSDKLTFENCMALEGRCTLTPAAQQTAWVASLASHTGRSCDVTKSRFVGITKSDGGYIYEVGCAKGAGFMFVTTPEGAYKRTIDCTEAGGIGGCTLTDQATIQAGALQSFGERLKSAGISCNVQKARLIGTSQGRDVVEYACSDRPAGLIVAFPAKAGQTPDVVDCLDSRHFGIQCEYTSHQAQMDLLSKTLAASGKSCTVSNFQNLGTTDAHTVVFEFACGSAPGGIAEVLPDYSKARKVDTCAEAAKTANKTGLSCSLPGNH